MKDVKREHKYIGFILGMVMTMLLSFGLICVMADPTEAPVSPTVPPAETTATQTVPAQSAEPPVTPATTTATVPPAVTTAKPVKTTPATKTTPPVQHTTPGGNAGTTAAPTLATATGSATATPLNTVPPFTVGPVATDAVLLPTYSPQVVPGVEPTEAPESTLDMHGYVLRIAATWDEYHDTLLNTEAITAFETKYNCKVQFLDLSKETLYNRLLMSAATGVTYFDAILVEGTEILVNLEPLGLLQSFSQYMTQEELDAIAVSYQKVLSKNGVLYGIPAKAPDVSGLWYNPAMVKAYQYTSSLDAYNSGIWSWDLLTPFLREATKDLDDDGYYNTYGVATSSPWYFSILESTGGSMFRWDGNQFWPGANNAVSLQGLHFIQSIYANRYVAGDYERYFYTGQTPYLAGELSMYTELKSYLKEQELHFMRYPSVNGLEPYTTVVTSLPSAAITATATYPKQTAELLKTLYGGEAFQQRIEAYCTESGFSQQIKTTYLNMLENFTVDYTEAFDSSGMIETKILSLLKNRRLNPETVETMIQPLLEQVIAEKNKDINLKEIPVEIRW